MPEQSHHAERSTAPGSRKTTPRQRQVLELASIGLSNHEIAARLHVSSRTIRFQFEKVFRTLGVRNRTDAVAAWMASRDHALRPPDECPYPKPFPNEFSECPAYLACQTVALDERGRPTGSVWTCRQLEARLVRGTENRWYGACILGTTVERQRWADRADRHRVRMINQLLHELAPRTRRFAQDFWALKADEVRAVTHRQDSRGVRHSMELLANRFMGDLETFLDRHRRLLEDNQLDVDATLDLARRLIDRVLAQRSPDWDDAFDALMRFPDDVWSESLTRAPEDHAQARR